MALASRLKTLHCKWFSVGSIDAIAAAADAALGVTERLFSTASVLANSAKTILSEQINGARLRFKFTTNDADAVADIWLAGKDSDELVRLCTVTLKAGNQDAADGKKLVDTITVTNDTNWTAASIVVCSPGADHCTTLLFDVLGFDKLLVHGNTTCDEDFIVEMSGV